MPRPVICLRRQCDRRVDRGHLFCERHVNDRLGVAVTRELRPLREALDPLRTARNRSAYDAALATLAAMVTPTELRRRLPPTLRECVEYPNTDLLLRHPAGLRLAMIEAILNDWDPNRTWWEPRRIVASAYDRFGPEIRPDEDDEEDEEEEVFDDTWKLTPEQRRQRWLAQRPDDPLLNLSGKALQAEYERAVWHDPPGSLQDRIRAIAEWEAAGETE